MRQHCLEVVEAVVRASRAACTCADRTAVDILLDDRRSVVDNVVKGHL